MILHDGYMRVKTWQRLACACVAALVCTIGLPPATPRASLTQKGTAWKKSQPVVYLALGDSTGVGIGAHSGSYVERLFIRIKRAQPAARLINACAQGASTKEVLDEQVRNLPNIHPTLITIGVGANDLIRGVKAEQFAQNYEQIVAHLAEETKARIVIMNIPDLSLAPAVPAYMRESARRQIVIFNERIEEIAKRHDLSVTDLYGRSCEFSAHPEFFSTDGLHPSEAGYEFWTEIVWPSVKQAIAR